MPYSSFGTIVVCNVNGLRETDGACLERACPIISSLDNWAGSLHDAVSSLLRWRFGGPRVRVASESWLGRMMIAVSLAVVSINFLFFLQGMLEWPPNICPQRVSWLQRAMFASFSVGVGIGTIVL